MEFAKQMLDFLGPSFLLLSPMLLFGLLLAGLLHVLVSRRAVLTWLSGENLGAISASAAIGVPVPLCSCSVVPVVSEMRNKGASRSACMSFLITAPETGADSILVTHAFFGFAAAIVRPIVSFGTAVVAGVLCMVYGRTRATAESAHPADPTPGHADPHCDHDHGDHCHGDHHTPLVPSDDDCYVSPGQIKAMAGQWLSRAWRRITAPLTPANARSRTWEGASERDNPQSAEPTDDSHGESQLTLGQVARHVFRYGFVDVADSMLFSLLVGISLGGVLFLVVPDGLMGSEAARWASYPAMLLVGVPLYICASASTPIAAALVAKGLSPGAALIFLMTGPATNSGTIAMIVSQFGRRFAGLYVGGVVAVTVVFAILVDVALIATGTRLAVNLSVAQAPALQAVQWAGAAGLVALMVWRFSNGAFRTGLRDLTSGLKPTRWRAV